MSVAACNQTWRAARVQLGCLLFGVHAAAAAAVEKTAQTAGTPVPPLQIEPLSGGGLAKIGFGLLVVVALMLVLSWGMRRVGGLAGGAGALRVLGGLSVGTRERVVLIQVADKQLLLGVAPGRVQTLHVLDEPIPTGPPADPGKSGFAASLSAALQRGKPS